MRQTMLALICVSATSPVFADGVSPRALLDPHVVPIVRVGEPLRAPMVISDQQGGVGICSNGQSPSVQTNTYGSKAKLACDHIAVGGAVLGLMYLLGSATATN
jgi:hypothetical protein